MGKVGLRKEIIEGEIIDYYSDKTDNMLDVDTKLIIYDDEVNITFYLSELKSNGKLSCWETRPLTLKEVEEVIEHYLNTKEKIGDNYKYVGGIKSVNYSLLDDTPIFEGIEVSIKNKGFVRQLLKK